MGITCLKDKPTAKRTKWQYKRQTFVTVEKHNI